MWFEVVIRSKLLDLIYSIVRWLYLALVRFKKLDIVQVLNIDPVRKEERWRFIDILVGSRTVFVHLKTTVKSFIDSSSIDTCGRFIPLNSTIRA